MTTGLVRCRMCGGKGILTGHKLIKTYGCYCERCSTQTDMIEAEQEAIDFWNKLMGVTLDDLQSFCASHAQCAGCPFKGTGCVVPKIVLNEELEDIVRAWRDGRYENAKSSC